MNQKETNGHLLEIKGLEKSYDGKKVVAGVDMNIKRGEIVGLLGPNGAGKTTTFYMVVGMLKPERGRIIFDNKDITRLPMYKRSRSDTCRRSRLFLENLLLKKI